MAFQLRSLFDFLLKGGGSRFRFQRRLAWDKGPSFVVTGSATFSPRADHELTVDYAETGKMVSQSAPAQPAVDVHQNYVFEFPSKEGVKATVHFSDGRLFHELDFSAKSSVCVAHWCSPDQYDGQYEILGPHSFRIRWRVDGPSKAYTSDTVYERE